MYLRCWPRKKYTILRSTLRDTTNQRLSLCRWQTECLHNEDTQNYTKCQLIPFSFVHNRKNKRQWLQNLCGAKQLCRSTTFCFKLYKIVWLYKYADVWHLTRNGGIATDIRKWIESGLLRHLQQEITEGDMIWKKRQ